MADKLTPFTFINSINQGRKGEHLLKDCKADESLEYKDPESAERYYVPFIINRGLSYFKDTAIFANEMNIRNGISSRMQYDFYRNIITPKRRFSKWGKKEKTSDDINIIKKLYNYSQEKAESVYKLLTKEQIKELHKISHKGGRV